MNRNFVSCYTFFKMSLKESFTKNKKLSKVWKIIRPFLVLVISAAIVFLITKFAIGFLFSYLIDPVDTADSTPIEIVIPEASSASKIAQILYNARGQDEKGLIASTAVFKVYVDFIGKAGNLCAGTYILSRNMSLKQIVDVLCEGNSIKKTVRFTIPEGYSVEDIAKTLKNVGLVEKTSDFLDECKGINKASFSFLSAIPDASVKNRKYVTEGYLFPDTYEAYTTDSVDSIVYKLLNRFVEVYTDEYEKRAEELGMSVDDVITLASLIEREAQAEDDFSKVSAVFHNRIKTDMPLQSCASLCYTLGVKKYTFTASEIETKSPFNTYQNKGLPAGPICNPGERAIRAALYPDQQYIDENYLYFCNGNLKISNELVFSKTYEEHQKNVDAYKQYWD